MKYGDFASLVQLGVGLHAGTALLQLYGEIGMQPLMRTLSRIRSLVSDEASLSTKEDLEQLESDFDIFRIRLFNEFKKYVVINLAAATLLVAILVWISYKADNPLSDSLSVVFVLVSVFPAPATLGTLWFDASRQLRPLTGRANDLQSRALGSRRLA
jgi:hypothetical protein